MKRPALGPRPNHPRPRHAHASVLAPSRSVGVIGAVTLAVALGIAGCAAAVGSSDNSYAHARAGTPKAPVARVLHGDPAPYVPGAAALVVSPPGGPTRAGELPLAVTPTSGVAHGNGGTGPASALAADGIPSTALAAYRQAAAREATRDPSCGIVWPLLAGIGRVESDHGRSGGAVLHQDGFSTPRIIGIALNGVGTAAIRDTDHGALDGDTVWDHAVGPMQFIPSTWAGWGVDADHDGKKDPNDIFDAAAAAADYLCAAGRNLTTYAGQVAAVRSYNDSDAYISAVLGLEREYARGVVAVPTAPGTGDSGPVTGPTLLPPVDPGRPRGNQPPGSPAPRPPAHASAPPHTPVLPKPSAPVPIPKSGAPSTPVPASSTPGCPGTASSAPTVAPSSSVGSPSSGTSTGGSSTSSCASNSTRASTETGPAPAAG